MLQEKHEIYFTVSDYKRFKRTYQFELLRKFSQNQFLLIAKAYFIDQQYSQCIEILQNKIPNSSNPKIIFQKYSLLFRATYLLNNEDDQKLQEILNKYQLQKNKIGVNKFKNYHNNVFKQFEQFLKIHLKNHLQKTNQVVEESQKQSKIDIKSIQVQLQKQKIFDGFPTFLVQKKWRISQRKFLQNNYQPHPGPITNFSIINHVFQIIPYQQKSRAYLNTILFPNNNNQVVNKKHWQFLQKIYSGIAVKRLQIKSDEFSKRSDNNDQTVTKIHILGNGKSIIMQLNISSLWSHANTILQKHVGLGQLKQKISKKYFRLVKENMRVGRQTEPLKYIIISQHSNHQLTEQDIAYRTKLYHKYDFEMYPMINYTSQGLIGIQNPKFFCYMIASIQCLSNTPKMTATFLENQHLENINFSIKNVIGSRGEITCAYADLLKTMWTFDKQQSNEQKQVNLGLFKETFGKRFDMFADDTQQDAHQFLNFFLNCLHDDLNIKRNESKIRNSAFDDTTSFQKIKEAYITFIQKNNQSIISKLFKSYTFSSLMCKQCKSVYYNFDMHLMITLPLPAANPSIGIRYISHKSIDEQIQLYKIFVSQIKLFKDLVELIRKHKKIEQDFEYHILKVKRKTFVFEQQVSLQTQINVVFPTLTQSYFILYELKKDSQIKILQNLNVSSSNKQTKIVKCLIQFKYNQQRKGIPRLISMNANLSSQQKIHLASSFISDASVSKIGSGIFTDKQKEDFIQNTKLEKVKNKSFDYILKVRLKNKINLFKESQIIKLGQECAYQNFQLQTCFKIYNQKQNITVNQNWNCQKCNQICEAEKQENIFQIGNNMIITLKRFKEDQKIYSKINYPINNFDMSNHISQKAKSLIPQKFIYDLYGVIIHKGNLNRGHYTAYCKHYGTKKWYYYDDQYVRVVEDEEQIINQNAYILFYQRRK